MTDTFTRSLRLSFVVNLSLIIACYNGSSMLEARVLEFEAVLRKVSWTWEILICDDGSTDDTAAVCGRLASQHNVCRAFSNPVNRGRGHAVRDAIPEARGRYVGYVDVDQSTAAAYLHPILEALEQGYDVAEVNRTYEFSLGSAPFIFHRYLAHKIYAWLVRQKLKIVGHDTEAGFKVFRKEALLRIREATPASGWFWDTEVIANAHALGFRVAEIPSVYIRTRKTHSTVRLLSDSIKQYRHLVRYAKQVQHTRLTGPCCQRQTAICAK